MTQLDKLLAELPIQAYHGPDPGNFLIQDVTADSRQVQAGTLFVAVPGLRYDGHDFMPAAIANGAVAIAGSLSVNSLPGTPLPATVPYIQVASPRFSLAGLAAALYGFPARQLTVIGVTGTDGKTTTCHLVANVLRAAGHQAGMISTVGATIGDEVLDTGLHVTTPDAPEMQRLLGRMVAAGCNSVVIEATSHGLHQERTAFCEFDIAVATNITHEHLDYHKTWQEYLEAKARLFRGLATSQRKPHTPKTAILNVDDGSYSYLRKCHSGSTLTYGIEQTANFRATQIKYSSAATCFQVEATRWGCTRFETPLLGDFNVYNSLAAIAVGAALELPLTAIQAGVAGVNSIAGRMERIHMGQDFVAVVDFAHSPAALQRALEAARYKAAPGGRVIVVFGCAGERDVAKRAQMAEVAIRLADCSIFTAEDPRNENLHDILAEMALGARQANGIEGNHFFRIADRPRAIQAAINMAHPGDVVIVCGKGHERSMCFGEVEHPWRDQQAVQAALAQRLGVPGPEFPRLPTGDEHDPRAPV